MLCLLIWTVFLRWAMWPMGLLLFVGLNFHGLWKFCLEVNLLVCVLIHFNVRQFISLINIYFWRDVNSWVNVTHKIHKQRWFHNNTTWFVKQKVFLKKPWHITIYSNQMMCCRREICPRAWSSVPWGCSEKGGYPSSVYITHVK